MNKKIIVLTGATASGKTSASIQIAKKTSSSIICADSRIVYKDIDIASAKPNKEEQENVQHHLIDIVTPFEDFSAGDFSKLSQKIINSSNDKYIIICGGTWFYIKSLLDKESLIECPINKELREELSNLSSDELFSKLEKLDINRSKLIHPNNKDKVIRSIELCLYLNQPLSEYQREKNINYDVNWYMFDIDREMLYQRINKRVDEMVELGLYSEWERNKEKYPNSNVLLNTIGYKEFYDFENGIYSSKNEAIEKIKQHTRNFAKRQLTYFRSNKDIKKISSYEDILKDLNV